MKKILIVFPFVLLGAFIAPTYAGTNVNNTYNRDFGKKKRKSIHERKEKSQDWANYETEQHFELDFPNAANVHWRQGYFEEATFNMNGSAETAYYDNDNNLVGTTNKSSYSSLPEKAKATIEKWYPDYTATQVIFFKDNQDNDTNMMLYSTSFDDGDNYFVELSNGAKNYVVKVDTDGQVSFFQQLY